jgi:uncharacterized metal-binding protein YceD (DUF177 family)
MKEKFVNSEGFKIHVEQLRHGGTEKIEEEFTPEFIDVHEEGLDFQDPIFVEGEAYVADHELILCLNVSTHALVPCSVCNEIVKVFIQVPKLYAAEPLENIKNGIFSMESMIREAIVLEAPQFVKCGQTVCLKHKEIEKYFHQAPSSDEAADEGYRPFEGLKLD